MTLPDSHLPAIAIPTSFPLMRDDHCSGVTFASTWTCGSLQPVGFILAWLLKVWKIMCKIPTTKIRCIKRRHRIILIGRPVPRWGDVPVHNELRLWQRQDARQKICFSTSRSTIARHAPGIHNSWRSSSAVPQWQQPLSRATHHMKHSNRSAQLGSLFKAGTAQRLQTSSCNTSSSGPNSMTQVPPSSKTTSSSSMLWRLWSAMPNHMPRRETSEKRWQMRASGTRQ